MDPDEGSGGNIIHEIFYDFNDLNGRRKQIFLVGALFALVGLAAALCCRIRQRERERERERERK